MKKLQFHTAEFKQFLKKYNLVYSPRATLTKQREQELMLINQIIKHFDPFTVNFLKKEFEFSNGKINKVQFIGCLKNHLLQWQPQAKNREQKLNKYLSKIFDEIDIAESTLISWEEFSNYLIGKASVPGGAKDNKSLSSIATGGGDDTSSQEMGQFEQIKNYSVSLSTHIPPKDKEKHKFDMKRNMGDSEGLNVNLDRSKKPNGYRGPKDDTKGSSLHKAIFLSDIDKVALVMERSDTIQFINPKNGDRSCKDLDCGLDSAKLQQGLSKQRVGSTAQAFKRKIIVMSMLQLRLETHNNLLMIATDDSLIRAWYYNGNQFVPVNPIVNEEPVEIDIKILKSKQPQYCLAWDEVHQMLYSGQRDGMINVWNLRQSKPVGFLGVNTEIQTSSPVRKGRSNQEPPSGKVDRSTTSFDSGGDNIFKNYSSQASSMGLGHKDIVTELLMLPKLQYLASSSLDKKVILWDTITGEQKRVYQEHTMGVVSLTFNSEHILLFSAGFDHDICVWNPYIDNPVFKVQAHSAPIVSLFAIDHTPQLISTDSDGIMKIWDIRNFKCSQTINCQENFEQSKFNLSYMLSIWEHKRLLVAGRQLLFFQYNRNQNPNLADDQAPLCCEYISRTQEFYTPALGSVKCWNALNGSVKQVFQELLNPQMAEITAFCMDLNQKRFMIGDSKGQIKIFNSVNIELMKTLNEHPDSEIINLMSVSTKEMDMIVSVGSNSIIQVHEDDKLNESAVRRTINITNHIIQTAKIYSYQQFKYLIVGLNKGQIKTYELETGRPDASYLAHRESSDVLDIHCLKSKPFFFSSDTIGNVSMWSGPFSAAKYQKCYTFQNVDIDQEEPSAVNCIVYNEEEDILFTGDEKGTIIAYQFKDIIQNIQIQTQRGAFMEDQALSSSSRIAQVNGSPQLQLLWRKKEHSESIRHLNYLQIYDQKLLISTAFDRKIKIWNALNGEHLDSLRKGNTDEAQPINFTERQQLQEVKFQPTPGKKKLLGLDFENLKKKVETNPAVERLKAQIQINTRSTKWNLFLDVDKILQQEQESLDTLLGQVLSEGRNEASQLALTQNQHDLEMMSKIHQIYQLRAAQMANESVNKGGQIGTRLMQSPSMPQLNHKSTEGSAGLGRTMSTQFGAGSEKNRTINQGNTQINLGIVSKMKNEVSQQVGMAQQSRKKRFQENKESLATLKLLYPSKFRNSNYRKQLDQNSHQGSETRFPSIITSKKHPSGKMLMEMIGIKEKRLPRNVSEAALKLVHALDKVEHM